MLAGSLPAAVAPCARRRGADVSAERLIGLREQYELETELAARLRSASADRRRGLYNEVYDELFRRAPRHLRESQSRSNRQYEQAVAAQVRLLRSLIRPNSVFLEIGPGDYRVVAALAELVAKAYAVDVALERAKQARLPDNVAFCLSDGVSVPVPSGSVTFAYSNQVMEHLHPDDAKEQLRNIHRSLRRGGMYLCVTPNRLSGPHDISRHYDDVASGLHLKEYSVTELAAALVSTGFSSVHVIITFDGRRLSPPLPVGPIRFLETLLGRTPRRVRRRLAAGLAAVKVVATK